MPLLNTFTTRQLLLLLAALALTLSASGFVLEYGFHVLPCKMCWWQRYIHWAVAAIALLGTVHPRLPRIAFSGILIVGVFGFGIAAWQFAAQHGWLPFPPTCAADPSQALASAEDLLTAMNQTKIVPCDKENFRLLGLSLAGWNIPAMLAILLLAGHGLKKSA
jgi:disulfide bond formation protein DsbB